MFKQNITLFFVLNVVNLFSQHSITGKVVDFNKSPLENTNIILIDIVDNQEITGTSTNEKGEFELNLDKDYKCKIIISYLGFKKWKKEIDLKQSISLGEIKLEESNILDEVTITARKKMITDKEDKTIFNVEISPLKSGYETLELLKVTPHVWVDMNNNILIHGEKATLFINGRKLNLSGSDLENYLSNISSENIKQIEVQTNQSANSDANTTGGMINIVLNKIKKGFRSKLNTSYTIKNNGYNSYSNIILNYGTNKWNVYSSYGYGIYDVFSETINRVDFLEQNDKIDTNTEKKSLSNNHNYTIGFVNQISKKHLIGFELFGRYRKKDYSRLGNASYYTYGILSNQGKNDVFGNGSGNSINGVVNYKWMISEKDNVRAYFDYANNISNDLNTTETFYNNSTYDNNENRYRSNSKTEVIAFQVDYKKLINDETNIDFGVKYTDTNRFSDLLSEFNEDGNYIENTNQTTDINFKEHISAIYLSADKKILEKNYFKIGLRTENTNINKIDFINNETIKKNYTNFFSSIYYSRTISNKKSISFSYSRSIRRPRFELLNDDIIKVNDFQYYIGNSDLNPEFTVKYEFKYNFKKHRFSIYYVNTKDKITEIYTIENDIAYHQTKNFGNQRKYGLEYGFSKKIKKWWLVKMSSYLYNGSYVDEQVKSSFNMTTYGARLYNNFKLDNKTSIEFSGFYRSPSIMAYYKGYEAYSINLAFKKSFMEKKLNLYINFNDIANTFSYKTLREFENFKAYYEEKPNRRAVRFKLTYNISNNKKVSKKKNKSKNETSKRI